MAEFPAFTPSPARVHDRARERTGHQPAWLRRAYEGGPYSVSHFRTCSWCRCIHPQDLIELLADGNSSIHPGNNPGKFLLVTPNPIAGDLIHRGSVSGRVFARDREPADLVSALFLARNPALNFEPTIGERLAGHFERPALEAAPELIVWPFYTEHTTDRQWAEIAAAAHQGDDHAGRVQESGPLQSA
jgi:hypothetical protein